MRFDNGLVLGETNVVGCESNGGSGEARTRTDRAVHQTPNYVTKLGLLTTQSPENRQVGEEVTVTPRMTDVGIAALQLFSGSAPDVLVGAVYSAMARQAADETLNQNVD